MQPSTRTLVHKAEYARMKGWHRTYLSKPEVIARLAPATVKDHDGNVLIDAQAADEIFRAQVKRFHTRAARRKSARRDRALKTVAKILENTRTALAAHVAELDGLIAEITPPPTNEQKDLPL